MLNRDTHRSVELCFARIVIIERLYIIHFCRRKRDLCIHDIKVRAYARAIANVRDMAPQIERTQITYAIEHDADYQAKNIVTIGQNTSFDVYYQEELCGQIVLNVPGKHNVLNALATVAAAREMGVEMEAIAEEQAFRTIPNQNNQ